MVVIEKDQMSYLTIRPFYFDDQCSHSLRYVSYSASFIRFFTSSGLVRSHLDIVLTKL